MSYLEAATWYLDSVVTRVSPQLVRARVCGRINYSFGPGSLDCPRHANCVTFRLRTNIIIGQKGCIRNKVTSKLQLWCFVAISTCFCPL